MMRLVSQRLTKIINIPNMKDHGATGATGCLKNIAYGSFSNVARTHQRGKSHTYSVVGTLASMEPLRSRTVLQIMDGLRGVWHGGPFARTTKYVFYPKQIMFGTDPVAIDRLLLDIIDNERKAHGAISIWDRSPASLQDRRRTRARRRSQRQHHHSRAGARRVRRIARSRRLRSREDQGAGADGLTGCPRSWPSSPRRRASTGRRASRAAPRSKPPGSRSSACPADQAETWRNAGFTVTAVTRRGVRRAGSAAGPWRHRAAGRSVADARAVDRRERLATHACGRGQEQSTPFRPARPPSPLAEAFAYGMDAVLKIDPADIAPARCDAAPSPRHCHRLDLPSSPTSASSTTGRRSPVR